MSEQFIHYENMKLFLEDAAVSITPWIYWQVHTVQGWKDLTESPRWNVKMKYRRKSEKVVNGFPVVQMLHDETSINYQSRAYIEAPSSANFVTYDFPTEREVKRGIVHMTQKSAEDTCKARLGIATVKSNVRIFQGWTDD